MNNGIFCISIDFELLWGRRDMPNLEYFKKRILKKRITIDKLLRLFEKYNIPATWATVGKIYKKGDLSYSGIDIIKKINKIKNQEIASHSYTHSVFTEISKIEAEKEFNNFKKKSFVFPKNQIKYLKELKMAGFKSFRGADKNPHELIIPRLPPVFKPKMVDGILNIPASMYFVSGRGLKRFIPKNLRYLKCKWGINNAIRQGKIFHLWFHPMDFVDDNKKIMSDFQKVIIYANKMRLQNKLDILNMDQIQTKFS